VFRVHHILGNFVRGFRQEFKVPAIWWRQSGKLVKRVLIMVEFSFLFNKIEDDVREGFEESGGVEAHNPRLHRTHPRSSTGIWSTALELLRM
jgi:hypothetical protein